MSLHQPIAAPLAEPSAPDRLRAALTLIECIAGEPSFASVPEDPRLHAAASAIARRRHDALAQEAAAFAAAGLAALLRCKERDGADPTPAAARLACELRGALEAMRRTVDGGTYAPPPQ